MSDSYDVVVVGAGPVGENAAGRVVDHGLTAAIVESELVGGECSFWACIPSKTLLRPGDVIAAARRVPGAAEAINGPIDATAALRRRDEMTSGWDDSGAVPWLDSKGITLVRGHGRLAGPRIVDVDLTDGGVRRLEARRAVVLATGSSAAMPPIDGLSSARPWDNRGVVSARTVPRRLIVLGGGVVGVEMAQAMRRLGAQEVTVIEGAERLLAREEPFAAEELSAAFAAERIDVRKQVQVTSAHRDATGVTVTLSDGGSVTGDELLVAVGRRPRTLDVGLQTVGLQPGRYVDVDDELRVTAVPDGWLYAVGDCNGRSLLTHMGKYQARIVGDVIAGKPARDRASSDVVTRVVFTDPQVCAAGLTEAQARERYDDIRVVTFGTGDVAGASVAGVGLSGTAKIVVDANRRVIVGATFTGPDLAELLHSATVAIAGRVTLDDLWHAVPSFPTVSEVWLRLLESYGL